MNTKQDTKALNTKHIVAEETAKLGIVAALEGEECDAVLDAALPREQARALCVALEARGLTASDAPDGDDVSLAWVYVSADH